MFATVIFGRRTPLGEWTVIDAGIIGKAGMKQLPIAPVDACRIAHQQSSDLFSSMGCGMGLTLPRSVAGVAGSNGACAVPICYDLCAPIGRGGFCILP
jgi:hypothetical protein